MTDAKIGEVISRVDELYDAKMHAVNLRHGDDHGVNLTKLRQIAKELKTQHDMALQLWQSENSSVRLLAILICRPSAFTAEELDTMLRETNTPKESDWFVNYVVKKHKLREELRVKWFEDSTEVVASAAWELTAERIRKNREGLDLSGLLDIIESNMQNAPSRLQWSMNNCLANIGIESEELRDRAIEIGERLEVLKDYPTAPNCTSPYAPVWITEMVKRRA